MRWWRASVAHAACGAGLEVDIVPAYETRPAARATIEALAGDLAAGKIDVATFTSSSTVRELCVALGPHASELLSKSVVAAIGPVTADTAREHGLTVEVSANEYTVPGLLDALERHFRAEPRDLSTARHSPYRLRNRRPLCGRDEGRHRRHLPGGERGRHHARGRATGRSIRRLFSRAIVSILSEGHRARAVVDPGVGTSRAAIAVSAAGHLFVGPDNGILSLAARRGRAVSLTRREYFLSRVSNTFHGRDIFAAVAAHLASGVALDKLGPSKRRIVKLASPRPRKTARGLLGHIVSVDRFGNLITTFAPTPLERAALSSLVGGDFVSGKLCSSYAAAPPGELLLVFGGYGLLENRGAQRFSRRDARPPRERPRTLDEHLARLCRLARSASAFNPLVLGRRERSRRWAIVEVEPCPALAVTYLVGVGAGPNALKVSHSLPSWSTESA